MRIAAAALVAVLLAGAWSAGWFYAAHEAGRQIDLWLKREATLGRDWTCPKRSVGGFPTAITVTCDGATFSGRGLGQNVEGSVSHLVAGITILHPTTATMRLDAPLHYATSDGDVRLNAQWKSVAIDVEGFADIRNVSLRGRDILVQGDFAGAGRQQAKANSLTADFVPSRQRNGPIIDFAIGLGAASIPLLDTLVGGQDPIEVAAEGTIDHTDIAARTPEEAAETWRRAGGSIALAKATASRGETSVKAHGTLRLDDEHRANGRLDATFIGLGPVLKRYGINGNLVAIGSLLSTMFGGKPSGEATEPGAVTLPVRFDNGRLAVGPIVTQVKLLPIY